MIPDASVADSNKAQDQVKRVMPGIDCGRCSQEHYQSEQSSRPRDAE